jgi:hypothetical protein
VSSQDGLRSVSDYQRGFAPPRRSPRR